jgi:signal peptidase II
VTRGWHWIWIAALVVALDQLTKAWITRHFGLDQTVTLLPVLSFTLRGNPGAAFSMLADASGWQRWFFSAVAIVVSLAILAYLYRMDARRQRLLAVGLCLILGGAVGNLIDRLRLGQVIDFVAVHWKDAYFPAFNVADSAITVGAILMLCDALILERLRSR